MSDSKTAKRATRTVRVAAAYLVAQQKSLFLEVVLSLAVELH